MTVKVLVPISGGKDSQAALKLALQHYPPEQVRGLFCDTQFEHPDTYAHVEKLRTLYGNIRIDTVTGGSVLEKCEKYGRFPGGGARHCTDELKIRETRIYCKKLAEEQGSCRRSKKDKIEGSDIGGFEVWYGMRFEESHERKERYAGKVCDEVYAPHEVLPKKYPQYLGKMGVRFRLAVLDWTTDEIFEFLEGQENPLYEVFDRVGCFPCQAAGDEHKEKAYSYDEFGRKQFKLVQMTAERINKPMFNSIGGQLRNACALHCGA